MAYDKLIAQIANRPIVIDESVNFFGLRPALDRAGVVWREFPRRTKDETIAEGMLPEEILLTRDFAFFKSMESRAILLPINNAHYKRSVASACHQKAEMKVLQANGTIDFRIMRGMRLLFTRKVKDWRGYTVLEPI